MTGAAPRPERVHIWIPDQEALVGSNLPEYDPDKGIQLPSFEDLVERFDQLKNDALTQHIGRVANIGQSVYLTKSYRPYITDKPDQEREVVSSIGVEAQWKNLAAESEISHTGVINDDFVDVRGLSDMMYVMAELEDATTEGRAIFLGRV